jgi:hypothetical protein
LAWRLTEKVQQVDQRPAQAIDGPCRDHIDVAPSDGLEQAIEARPLVAALGAGDTGVLKELDLRSGPTRGPGVDVPGAVQSGDKS